MYFLEIKYPKPAGFLTNFGRVRVLELARCFGYPSQHYIAEQFVCFILRPCQHDDGYIDGRSQFQVHTDERTQAYSAQSSLVVSHPSTNRGRRCLTSVNVPLS